MPADKPAANPDFDLAFEALKRLVAPYEKLLKVTEDEPRNYVTYTPKPCYKGKPLMFAGVASKSYVAFHFFPVYMFPKLIAGISPELKKRMQGKTCWNFKQEDKELFRELGGVVKAGFECFRAEGYL